MKHVLAGLLSLVLAACSQGGAEAWTHGSSIIGTTYYLSPTGSDGANGLTPATAWLTPNHAVNCGDVILAEPSQSYNSANFFRADWGTVSNCPSTSGVYFAQLKCNGPLMSCKAVDTTVGAGMLVDKSNWAVSGWTSSSTTGSCFIGTPSSAAKIHHVAFINTVGIDCFYATVNFFPYFGDLTQGIDQTAIVGVMSYNSARGGDVCGSGVSIYAPTAVDLTEGTHVYVAGVFSIASMPEVGCHDDLNQDGNGIIFDTWTGYTGQSVMEQSMALWNGGIGFFPLRNTAANVYVRNVTSYGNVQFTSRDPAAPGAEVLLNLSTAPTIVSDSIFQASLQTQNGANIYGAWVNGGDADNSVTGNYIFGVSGQNTNITFSPGFSFGSNTLADPQFVNPALPSEPNCADQMTTTQCAVANGIVANFTPQAVGAVSKGYQLPGPCAPNALYPNWLKGVVPPGIITKPCGL